MGFARIDHRFQLGIGQQPLFDQTRRQMWAVARLGRCDRGHRRRLHQAGGMRLGTGDADRLERVGLIERVGEFAVAGRLPIDQLVIRAVRRMAQVLELEPIAASTLPF